MYQSGASASSLDRRDRNTLIGAYASGGTPYVGYVRGGRPAQFPYAYSYPAVSLSVAAPAGGGETEEDAQEPQQQQQEEEGDVDGEEEEVGASSNGPAAPGGER